MPGAENKKIWAKRGIKFGEAKQVKWTETKFAKALERPPKAAPDKSCASMHATHRLAKSRGSKYQKQIEQYSTVYLYHKTSSWT